MPHEEVRGVAGFWGSFSCYNGKYHTAALWAALHNFIGSGDCAWHCVTIGKEGICLLDGSSQCACARRSVVTVADTFLIMRAPVCHSPRAVGRMGQCGLGPRRLAVYRAPGGGASFALPLAGEDCPRLSAQLVAQHFSIAPCHNLENADAGCA